MNPLFTPSRSARLWVSELYHMSPQIRRPHNGLDFETPWNYRSFIYNLQYPDLWIFGSCFHVLFCDQWSRLNCDFKLRDFSFAKYSTCRTFEVPKFSLILLLTTSPYFNALEYFVSLWERILHLLVLKRNSRTSFLEYFCHSPSWSFLPWFVPLNNLFDP